jgi:hypothetical protein
VLTNGSWVTGKSDQATPVPSYVFVEPVPVPPPAEGPFPPGNTPGNTPGPRSMLEPEKPDFSNVIMIGYIVVVVLLLVAFSLFFKSAARRRVEDIENNSLMVEENSDQAKVGFRNVLAE